MRVRCRRQVHPWPGSWSAFKIRTMEDQTEGTDRRKAHRRMVHRLLAHWRDAQEEGGFPSLDAVLKRDLSDILPSIFVLKVPADAAEPAFARVGKLFAGEVAGDLTGRPVSAVPEGTLLEQAVGIYDEVLARKVPITRAGEFAHVQGGTVLYRSIILPLSEDQDTIDSLLGAANSKIKDEEA